MTNADSSSNTYYSAAPLTQPGLYAEGSRWGLFETYLRPRISYTAVVLSCHHHACAALIIGDTQSALVIHTSSHFCSAFTRQLGALKTTYTPQAIPLYIVQLVEYLTNSTLIYNT
jgi:hypothetical protein